MRPFEFKPFAREDLPDQAWAEKLIRPLNSILGQLRSGLTNGLTLAENLNAEIKTIDVAPTDPWVVPSLGNSWVDFGGGLPGAAYQRDGNTVSVRGCLKSGTLTAAAFTLPAAYRPAVEYQIAAVSNTAFGLLVVNTSGGVVPYAGSNASFWISASFPAGATAPLPRPGFPVRFQTKVRGRAKGVVALRCAQIDGRDERAVNAAVSVDWRQDSESVTLDNVAGLVPGLSYRLTLLVIGG